MGVAIGRIAGKSHNLLKCLLAQQIQTPVIEELPLIPEAIGLLVVVWVSALIETLKISQPYG